MLQHIIPRIAYLSAGNTQGGSITEPLTSCLTRLDWSVLQIKTKIDSWHTADSKPLRQEVSGTVILPLLVFPGHILFKGKAGAFPSGAL